MGTLAISIEVPPGGDLLVTVGIGHHQDGPTAVPAVAQGRAAPAPVTAGAAAPQQALVSGATPAARPQPGSVRTWVLSTGERAFFTFAASFVSALTLSGPFSIPAVDAALFAGASAAIAVVTAAIRSLTPSTDNKAMDVVTRVGLTALQAFTAAFVTSTAGATHLADWRAGALAGVAAAFTALKCTYAVRRNGASATSGERPTPASLVPLHAGAPRDASLSPSEVPA